MCPNCNTSLQKRSIDHEDYYVCPKCSGVLAGRHAVKKLIKNLPAKEKPPHILRSIPVKKLRELEESKHGCPQCHKTMHKQNYLYDSNVFVDVCEKCKLIWFEKDELQRIAAHTKSPVHERLAQAVLEMDELSEENRSPDAWMPKTEAVQTPLAVGDETPSLKTPWATILIILITFLAFANSSLMGPWGTEKFFNEYGVSINNLFSIAIVTSIFLHLNLPHFVFNILYLWVFADNIEDALGHGWFFIFYIVLGVVTNLAFVLITRTPETLIGASGAISAIMGAYYVLYPNRKIRVIVGNVEKEMPSRSFLYLWLTQQGFSYLYYEGTGVAWLAHIIGFILGMAVTFFLRETKRLILVDYDVLREE